MNIQLFPHALNQSQVIGAFQNNSILKGKVLDILPNNLALVELGNEQLTAKVEGVLKRDSQYLFQVKKSTEPVTLKVINTAEKGVQGQPEETKSVIKLLNLKDSPAMQKLIRLLTKEQVPLQKESLLQAAELFTKSKQPMDLVKPVKWIIEKQLPMNTFTAKLAEAAVKPSVNIAEFMQQLKALDEEPGVSAAVKKVIGSLPISEINTPETDEKTVFTLLKSMSPDAKNGPLAAPFIQQIQKQAGAVSPQENLLTVFQESVKHAPDLKTVLKELFPSDSMREASAKLTEIIRHEPLLMLALQSGSGTKPDLQQLFLKMGFQHEQQLAQSIQTGGPVPPDAKENMKAALIQLSQDSSASPAIRQNADSVLQQMTLQQLQMSAGDKGWLQWAMQLPLPIRDTFKKASFFWEGKSGSKEGTLDPDHCHILCYLDLEKLKETMIQIRIQDRFISLTVHNEHHKLAGHLKKWEAVLKAQLANHNYHLVSLSQSEKIEEALREKLSQTLFDNDRQLDVKI